MGSAVQPAEGTEEEASHACLLGLTDSLSSKDSESFRLRAGLDIEETWVAQAARRRLLRCVCVCQQLRSSCGAVSVAVGARGWPWTALGSNQGAGRTARLTHLRRFPSVPVLLSEWDTCVVLSGVPVNGSGDWLAELLITRTVSSYCSCMKVMLVLMWGRRWPRPQVSDSHRCL